MCALTDVRIICCIYLHGNVQIFDNKRHTCSMEYLSGYFKLSCPCLNTACFTYDGLMCTLIINICYMNTPVKDSQITHKVMFDAYIDLDWFIAHKNHSMQECVMENKAT